MYTKKADQIQLVGFFVLLDTGEKIKICEKQFIRS